MKKASGLLSSCSLVLLVASLLAFAALLCQATSATRDSHSGMPAPPPVGPPKAHDHSHRRLNPARRAPIKETRRDIMARVTSLAKSIECTVCDMILQFVDQEIGTNATEQEIVAILQDVCGLFSSLPSWEAECKHIIASYGYTLVFILQEEFAANRVCDELDFCITNKTQPVHVHLAFAGGPDQMSASWFTYGATQTSVVRWKQQPNGNVVGTATGTAESYLKGGGYTHKTVMTGLQPNTRYYYSVGDPSGGWSPYYSFVTPPAQARNFSVAIYGDMGVHNSENTFRRVQSLVNNKQIDWIFHVGDIGYGDDYPGNVYEYVWNSWFRNAQNASAQVAYQVCPGNHEYNCQHPTCAYFSGNFAAYNSRFRMPGAESGSNTNMWYSFDYSYVHFVSISTETDYPESPYPSKFGNQLLWLQNDLQKANASRSAQRPWIIAVGHRPIYSSSAQRNSKADDYAIHIQSAIEDMFHAYGVDIYFSGHVHSYERIYPTYQNQKVANNYFNPPATSYVVSGAAGCIEGLSGFPTDNPPVWNAAHYNEDQGYGVLDVGPTTLGWTYYSSSDGVERDSFVLTKTKLEGWRGMKKI